MSNDTFELFDLEVVIEGEPSTFVCSHKPGVALKFVGENVSTVQESGFSFYSLSTLLPLIASKQRATDPNDWMTTDELIACPDPNCGAKFRINRVGKRSFSHAEVTKVPLR